MISVVAIWISVMITQCSNIWHDQQLRPPSQRLLLAKHNWADLASAYPSNFGEKTIAQLRCATNLKKKICEHKIQSDQSFNPRFHWRWQNPVSGRILIKQLKLLYTSQSFSWQILESENVAFWWNDYDDADFVWVTRLERSKSPNGLHPDVGAWSQEARRAST